MDDEPGAGRVVAVSRDDAHRFSKPEQPEILLVAGYGIEGDAHAGPTVQHRSRAARAPAELNLRQVHLIHTELHAELAGQGFDVGPGDMGENVTTAGIDLLGLPRGALLHLGESAVIEVTGLRNPCKQLNTFQPGLMKAVLGRTGDGQLVRKAGVMGIVAEGGVLRPGDGIRVERPPRPHAGLEPI